MTLKSVIEKQKDLLRPSEKDLKYVTSITNSFLRTLRSELNKSEYGAQAFIGGSYAKNTILKKYDYDIDVFVRFPWQYDEISRLLEPILKKVCKTLNLGFEKLHGSRDYFRCKVKNEGHFFEVIPVTKIKKPQEERNVTDLSYFHVSYIKDKIQGLEDDVRLVKTFMHGQGVYGAESYIHGFSGYAVECLIIYYKSFLKMLREIIKLKTGERIVIDIEKFYKRKSDVFFDMNENKLNSPIILVDPTNRERNALASLSHETFTKFQKASKKFLKKPSLDFFKEKEISETLLKKEAKKKKAELIKIEIKTDRQKGDIAGTKLKKFYFVLMKQINLYFKILRSDFQYDQEQKAELFFILKSRNEVVRIGPPLHMKKYVKSFISEHRSTYEKNRYIHAKIPVNFTGKAYLDSWKKGNEKTLDEMSITDMKLY